VVGRGNEVAAEAGRPEHWQDGEGRGRMADGGGDLKAGRGWARLRAVGQYRPRSGGAERAARTS
jgi:hypothetical protein